MGPRLRRILATAALTATAIVGATLTTASAADDSTQTSADDHAVTRPAPKPSGPVFTPMDTWWG